MNPSNPIRAYVIVVFALFLFLQAGTAGGVDWVKFEDSFDTPAIFEWPVTKNGGVIVGVQGSESNKWLDIAIPGTATGNPNFWGGITSWDDISPNWFFIEEYSRFSVSVDLKLLKWPRPYKGNGIRAALCIYIEEYPLTPVWHQYCVGHMSDGDYTSETEDYCKEHASEPGCSGDVMFTTFAQNKPYAAGNRWRLYITRTQDDDGHAVISAVCSGFPDLGLIATPYWGKVVVEMLAWGPGSIFPMKDVRVAFDNVRVASEKGFIVPAAKIQVNIEPDAAVKKGGWKVDGKPAESWLKSGDEYDVTTLHDFKESNHVVSFEPIVSWTPPKDMKVALQYNKTTKATGTYVKQSAVIVVITPDEANTAGAQWKVDRGEWQDSGAKVTHLDAGDHTLSFRKINGWTQPATQQIKLKSGKTTKRTVAYIKN